MTQHLLEITQKQSPNFTSVTNQDLTKHRRKGGSKVAANATAVYIAELSEQLARLATFADLCVLAAHLGRVKQESDALSNKTRLF
jgi:hypothetical protein